jgi:hypothetical protein
MNIDNKLNVAYLLFFLIGSGTSSDSISFFNSTPGAALMVVGS